MFDKIVFSKIKERLGGRVRLVVSGERRRVACYTAAPRTLHHWSIRFTLLHHAPHAQPHRSRCLLSLNAGGAPLARHVEDFLKVTMCCRVVQVGAVLRCAVLLLCGAVWCRWGRWKHI